MITTDIFHGSRNLNLSCRIHYLPHHLCFYWIFRERSHCLYVAFTICRPPSVCRSVCHLSVTFVRPTQVIQIFPNVSMPFATLAISDLSINILRKSCQGNPFVRGGGVNMKLFFEIKENETLINLTYIVMFFSLNRCYCVLLITVLMTKISMSWAQPYYQIY